MPKFSLTTKLTIKVIPILAFYFYKISWLNNYFLNFKYLLFSGILKFSLNLFKKFTNLKYKQKPIGNIHYKIKINKKTRKS
jgi:hypothetical protein